MFNNIATELTMIWVAATPARMLANNNDQPPNQPNRGPMALAPQVKTVPESGAEVVKCLYESATKNMGMTDSINTIGNW